MSDFLNNIKIIAKTIKIKPFSVIKLIIVANGVKKPLALLARLCKKLKIA